MDCGFSRPTVCWSAGRVLFAISCVGPPRAASASAIRISRNCTVVTEDAAPWSVQLFDIPSVGRSAVLTDPQGAVFSVLKPSQQP